MKLCIVDNILYCKQSMPPLICLKIFLVVVVSFREGYSIANVFKNIIPLELNKLCFGGWPHFPQIWQMWLLCC